MIFLQATILLTAIGRGFCPVACAAPAIPEPLFRAPSSPAPPVAAPPEKPPPSPSDQTETTEPAKSSRKLRPWPLPWKQDVTYEYDWFLTKKAGKPSGRPNGTTSFTLSWDQQRAAITCKAEFAFQDGYSFLGYRFYSIFTRTLRPVLYASRAGGGVGPKAGGGAGVTAHFGADKIKVQLGVSTKSPRQEFPIPRETFWLYGHQAIHHWAIFLAMVDLKPTSLDSRAPITVKTFMPDILRFVDITFTNNGTEEVKGITASRLKFNAERLFTGTVWVGPDKRMLRYQQNLAEGRLDIWFKGERKEEKKEPEKEKNE